MTLTRLDAEGHRIIERANAVIAAILGEPDPERLTGRDFAEFIHPDDEAESRSLAAKLAETAPAEIAVHRRLQRSDGTTAWVQVRGRVLQHPARPGTYVLAYYVDVSAEHLAERRRRGEALVANRLAEFTTRLLAGADVQEVYGGLVATAAELACSQNATLLVRSSEGVLARMALVGPAASQLAADAIPVPPSLFETVLVGGGSLSLGAPPPDADPRLHQVSGPMLLAAVPFDPQELALLGVARPPGAARFDAVERDLLDELAARAGVVLALALGRTAQERRIRASEELFRLAFDQGPVGMALTREHADGHRTILRANAPLAAFLGVSDPAGLVGHDWTEFGSDEEAPEDPLGRQPARTGQPAAVSTRTPGQVRSETSRPGLRRLRYRCADGVRRWADTRARVVPVPDPSGPVTLGHFTDVTAQQRAQRRFRGEAVVDRRLAELTARLLAGGPLEEIYIDLTAAAAEVGVATDVTLVVPHRTGGEVRPVAAFGVHAVGLLDQFAPPDLLAAVLHAWNGGPAVSLPFLPAEHRLHGVIGPLAVVPLALGNDRCGGLCVARPPAGRTFDDLDLELLDRVASQVGLVIDLALARADQERLLRLEDRTRIARDLHDTVIQDLIAIGLQLNRRLRYEQAGGRATPDAGARGASDRSLVGQLEAAVQRPRASVFALREGPATGIFTDGLHATIRNAARVLGHQPTLTVRGPANRVSPATGREIEAVVREALSSVARHARASATTITVQVTVDRIDLTVEDDGQGIPAHQSHGDGLANLAERAQALGGDMTHSTPDRGGTRPCWWCSMA